MKCAVAGLLVLSLVSVIVFGQTTNQRAKPGASAARSKTLKICQGVPIPEGYIIVAYESLSSCPHGAYVLKKDDGSQAPATASRPRKVKNETVNTIPLNPPEEISTYAGPPELKSSPVRTSLDAPLTAPSSTSLDDKEEVSEGDVVRIDTNLVTVPVSVLDRDGRFISDVKREEFKVFENGVEQKLAYFDSTEKPFTVALLLDTSGSTFFHLWEIKEAAIAFAKQLRPQDRVLIVTFDRLVMLLTEATNDQNVITEAVQRNAITGFSTRLYDAIDLVIKARLNKIEGRKAMIVTTTITGRNIPTRSSSEITYGTPKASGPGTSIFDYKLADQFLHQLATKTGGRLYEANERTQLTEAFSKIAEELRHQYSIGYYPQTTLQSGERREIRVRVDRPELAVRARDSYVQRVTAKP